MDWGLRASGRTSSLAVFAGQMIKSPRPYGAKAAREISAQALRLRNIHNSRGADGVREGLAGQAETREAVHLNSWQAVT
jgi:hypothetical protein